ncbi:MAG: DUF4397 domain-containing protein [Gemmatimonadaceae bacterium]
MTYRITTAIAAIAALSVAAACGNNDNSTNPTPQTARVRVVNLDPSSANAGLFANGTAVGSNVAFGSAGSTCINVPVGQTLSFRAAGSGTDLVSNSNANFTAGQNYTVVLYRNGSGPQQAVLSDGGATAPSSGNNALRFFNATGTAGDIYVTSNGATISGTPSRANLAAGSATTGTSAWMNFPNTNSQIRMFNVGTSTGTPRVNTTFTSSNLSANGIGTAFLTESNMTGTSTNASVVAGPCS